MSRTRNAAEEAERATRQHIRVVLDGIRRREAEKEAERQRELEQELADLIKDTQEAEKVEMAKKGKQEGK